jgi:hypothetical protein
VRLMTFFRHLPAAIPLRYHVQTGGPTRPPPQCREVRNWGFPDLQRCNEDCHAGQLVLVASDGSF